VLWSSPSVACPPLYVRGVASVRPRKFKWSLKPLCIIVTLQRYALSISCAHRSPRDRCAILRKPCFRYRWQYSSIRSDRFKSNYAVHILPREVGSQEDAFEEILMCRLLICALLAWFKSANIGKRHTHENLTQYLWRSVKFARIYSLWRAAMRCRSLAVGRGGPLVSSVIRTHLPQLAARRNSNADQCGW
jgi:hypothetical protein